MTSIASAFVPVHDPVAAADWYREHLGLTVESASSFSAVLTDGSRRVTLMGPRSGIAATPGLPWASASYRVDDVARRAAALRERGLEVTDVAGDASVCLFITTRDLDDNVVLVVDR